MTRGLLDIESLSREDIETLLVRSKDFQPPPGAPFGRFDILRGRTVVNSFSRRPLVLAPALKSPPGVWEQTQSPSLHQVPASPKENRLLTH